MPRSIYVKIDDCDHHFLPPAPCSVHRSTGHDASCLNCTRAVRPGIFAVKLRSLATDPADWHGPCIFPKLVFELRWEFREACKCRWRGASLWFLRCTLVVSTVQAYRSYGSGLRFLRYRLVVPTVQACGSYGTGPRGPASIHPGAKFAKVFLQVGHFVSDHAGVTLPRPPWLVLRTP